MNQFFDEEFEYAREGYKEDERGAGYIPFDLLLSGTPEERTAEPVWQTRDGERIAVSQMDPDHLVNCYRYQRRRAQPTAWLEIFENEIRKRKLEKFVPELQREELTKLYHQLADEDRVSVHTVRETLLKILEHLTRG